MKSCRIAVEVMPCHEDADVTGPGFLFEGFLGFREENWKLSGFRDNDFESLITLFVHNPVGSFLS